jgi:hypothetical protein
MPRRRKSTDTAQSALGRRGFLKAATLASTGAIAGAGAIAQAVASPEAAESPPRRSVQLTSRESNKVRRHIWRALRIRPAAAISWSM